MDLSSAAVNLRASATQYAKRAAAAVAARLPPSDVRDGGKGEGGEGTGSHVRTRSGRCLSLSLSLLSEGSER